MSDREPDGIEVSGQAPRPWSLWATIGLSLVIGAIFFSVMTLWALGYFAVEITGRPQSEWQPALQGLEHNGFVVFSSLVVAGLAGVGVTLFFARLRKGFTVHDYLCLRPVGAKVFFAWLGIVVVVLVLFRLLAMLLEPQNVAEMYLEFYETSVYPAIFWIAVVVMAPLFEEIFFRGFMFRGIEASRLGAPGAILITALIWAVIHIQYDAFLMGYIFVLGVVFGAARARHRSVYLTIALHALVNLIATVEILLVGAKL